MTDPAPANEPVTVSTDVKDHIAHIRTIHFSIVVACFGLVAASLLSQAPEAVQALTQVRAIERAVNRWEGDWIWRHVRDSVNPSHQERTAVGDSFVVSTQSGRVLVAVLEGWSTLGGFEWRDVITLRGRAKGSFHESQTPPRSLKDFAAIWDRLPNLQVTYVRGLSDSGAVFVDRMATTATLELAEPWKGQYPPSSFLSAAGDSQPVVIPAILARAPDSLNLDIFLRHLSMFALGTIKPSVEAKKSLTSKPWSLIASGSLLKELSRIGLVIPVEVFHIRTDVQFKFARDHGLNADPGPFPHAFRELHRIAWKFADLPLGKIDTIIEGETHRSEDRLELFGTKLPTNELLRWGIPVLLIVQIYLWIHLDALLSLARLKVPIPQIAWIGMYRSKVAQALTGVSAAILPAVAASVLVVRSPPSSTSWDRGIVSFLIALLVFVAAWLSIRALGQLWMHLHGTAPAHRMPSQ